MKGSKRTTHASPERSSERRKLLTRLVWVVGIFLSFGMYTLLGRALAHDGAGEANPPPRSLAAPDQAAVVKVDPAVTTVSPGDVFSVTVEIEDVVDLGAFEFEITYDSTCVEATDATLGFFLGSTGRDVSPVGPTIEAGSVTYGAYSWGEEPGPNGNGPLAAITLEAGMSSCSSALHLQKVVVVDTEGVGISTSTEDGQVTVGVGVAPEVTSISPNWGYGGRVLENVILEGDHFQENATAQLTKSGQSPIFAPMPDVQSSNRISCTFNLGKAVLGKWTVRVTNPDGRYDELVNGFTVKAGVYLPVVQRNH